MVIAHFYQTIKIPIISLFLTDMILDVDHGINYKKKILITQRMEIFTHLLQALLE